MRFFLHVVFTFSIFSSALASQEKFLEVQSELVRLGPYHDAKVLDSLYHLAFRLGKTKYHEEVVHLYALFGARHIGLDLNLDTCFHYLTLAERLSLDMDYTRTLARTQIHLAHYYNIQGDLGKSIDYLTSSKRNVSKLEHGPIRSHLEGFIYTLSGDIYQSFNMYDSALTNYQWAVELASQKKDLRVQLKALNQMGSLYASYGENEKARTCFIKSITLSQEGYSVASSIHNIAELFLKDKEYDSALKYFLRSYSIRKEEGRTLHTVSASLAKLYAIMAQPDSSFYYLNKLDTGNLSSIDNHHILSAFTNAFIASNNLEEARKCNQHHLNVVRHSGNLAWHLEAVENRMLLERSNGNFKEALTAFEALKLLQDSLLNIEKVRSLMELDTRYEMKQREQEIASLGQKNEIQQLLLSRQQLLWISSVSILLLIIFLVVLWFSRKSTLSKERQLLLEQNLLRSQMNPHFIFNTLASIQGFITRNDRKEAATFLAKFGELTRDILDASRKEFISLAKELEMMENYVALEQARFSKSLILQVDHSELDTSSILISPMIVQPFIENAIKHGFKGREEGLIKIHLQENDGTLHVTITDDGRGIEGNLNDKEKSLATKIVKERLQLMRNKVKDVVLSIRNVKDAEEKILGVQVDLNLPLRYAK